MTTTNPTPMNRRRLLKAAAGATCVAAFAPAFAQTFPNRPINLVVGYPPGSSSDLMARMLAKPLGDILNVPLVVETTPGASGSAAATSVARSRADGYTLYYGLQDSQILVPLLKRNSPYNPETDFTPIAEVVDLNLVVVANAATNIKTMQQLLARAKEKPGELKFSSSGIGGIHHLTMEMLMQRSGTRFLHVPYQGGGPALTGLLRGDTELMVGSEALVKPHVAAGKLIALATSGKERSTQLKDVPTLKEAGVLMTMSAWYGVFGPANMPEAIAARLAEAMRAVVATPEYQQQVRSVGAEPTFLARADFAAFLKEETRNYKDAIDKAGIKIQDY